MAPATFERRIKDESHVTNCFTQLNSLWKSEQLCDITLKVGDSEFKAHKVILMACSLYFKNMFTDESFIESGRNYVEISEIDVDVFKSILEYFYTGYLTLTENTVGGMLHAAYFLILTSTSVKSICCQYLLKNIALDNCVQRFSLGVSFGLESLKNQTKSLIMEQLDKVSKTQEFYAINQEIFTELLTSNKGNDKGEEIYNATMKWVRHDLDNRKSLLSDLLVLIPTKNISYDFCIENMKNDNILRGDAKCALWVLNNIIEKSNSTSPETSPVDNKPNSPDPNILNPSAAKTCEWSAEEIEEARDAGLDVIIAEEWVFRDDIIQE